MYLSNLCKYFKLTIFGLQLRLHITCFRLFYC